MDHDEVITPWRKSSYSNSSNCVEIARTRSGKIAVRDSKDPDGPVLTFSPDEWKAFAAKVRANNLLQVICLNTLS